jgi:hypothetical protein
LRLAEENTLAYLFAASMKKSLITFTDVIEKIEK